MSATAVDPIRATRRAGGLPDFELPRALEAGSPAEVRGGGRDDVRMLVTRRSTGLVAHARLRDLPDWLEPGDLLVVNVSQPLPVAVPVESPAGDRWVHLATPLPGGDWIVEPRRREGHGTRELAVHSPVRWPLVGDASVELLSRHGPPDQPARLWQARLSHPDTLEAWLDRVGEPVRYAYTDRAWSLARYRTVYGTLPGSAESPSAGRPLTWGLLDRIRASGVGIAPVVLHCGVSTAPAPLPERFAMPAVTARLVNATRRRGGRVIAVGTAAVRAVETATAPDGSVHPDRGWTHLEIGPARPVRAVDGLLTGWHEPDSSHLRLLTAFADGHELAANYRAALRHGYLWHEFGDLHLLLPSGDGHEDRPGWPVTGQTIPTSSLALEVG